MFTREFQWQKLILISGYGKNQCNNQLWSQHIKRSQLSEDSILSYRGAKSIFLKIWYKEWFWHLKYFWIFIPYSLSHLIFDVKAAFSCKNGRLNCFDYANTQIPEHLGAFLLKSVFTNSIWCHQWNYHILKKLNVEFQNFCIKIEIKE